MTLGQWRTVVVGFVLTVIIQGSGLTIVAAGESRSSTLPPVSQDCPRLVVPAYFDPGPAWDQLIDAAPYVEFIILNPNNGPGQDLDPEFRAVVRRAQAAGIKILGYVHTDLAERPLAEMKAEVRAYEAWYGVDGIHIDGAQDDPEFIPYYRDLAETIRAAGPEGEDGIVWLNPGYVPDEGFMEFVDIVEVYEWFYTKYPAQQFPNWIYQYPADRFAHVVYDTPSDEGAMKNVLDLASRRNAGYVYVTDFINPREYAGLPSFWTAKLDLLCSPGGR